MAELTIDARDDGTGVVKLALAGEFDLAGIERFDTLIERVESGAPETIVIDLSALEFMDSSGLRALLMADRRARREGRRLAIVPGPESVRRVFEITQLDGQLDLID